MRGASGTPRAQEQEALQLLKPPIEGGGSRRHDGIARQGHGRPNHSPSEDQATGHDDEIVGQYEETLEERESTAAAAALTMAWGPVSYTHLTLPTILLV